MEGIVVRGLGEGAYFMSMEHYRKEIKNKLGFDAFPGTLNIRINKNTGFLENYKALRIEGYRKGDQVFGGASCYKAKIDDISGFIIVPDINKQKEDIIEFIASVNIRSKLNLKGNDKVKIEISQE